MIDSDLAQALVARCLSNPNFLTRVKKVITQNTSHPTTEDFAARILGPELVQRLVQLQGFITKVKHNGIRRELPYTFRLLADSGLELDFFSLFSTELYNKRQNGPLSTDQHLALISQALKAYLVHRSNKASFAIAEMLHHELSLRDILLKKNYSTVSPLVVWNGQCVVAQHRFDLIDMKKHINQGANVSNFQENHHYLLYQVKQHSESVSINEIDMLTAFILHNLTTSTSYSTIAKNLSKIAKLEITKDDILNFSREAVDAGIILSITENTVES
ncbi:hypothetical protein ACMGGD_06445 [Pseudomonas sp. BNK-6]|uniref:hypothetical protein n=1 Tax=unclassified Pseudomonas TaxID=196821 RepID=UPI003A8B122B